MPEQRRIGFSVGVMEDGEGEEKFTTLSEGLRRPLRASVSVLRRLGHLASYFGLSTRANSFFFRLVFALRDE